MQSVLQLKRENLSDAAETAIRGMIVDGRLASGERLNEVHLAEALGVSRTPLREALNRLAHEGAIETRARLGYFVKPLTLAEFEQLYDVRPILDPAALRAAGIPDAAQLASLEKLNRKFAAARAPQAAMALDDEWHLALLAHCPNRVLVELIENMMLRTRRYELALMRETKNVVQAGEDHDRIMEALRAGDIGAACAALEKNMRGGRAEIVAWLRGREPQSR